jgi:hypothetical protein
MLEQHKHDKFLERLHQIFPTDKEKLRILVTILGCSARLVEYLGKKEHIKNLDTMTKYAASLVCANMVALTSDTIPKEIKDFSEYTKSDDYVMSEQTQERILRVMKEIVRNLYEDLFEKEK